MRPYYVHGDLVGVSIDGVPTWHCHLCDAHVSDPGHFGPRPGGGWHSRTSHAGRYWLSLRALHRYMECGAFDRRGGDVADNIVLQLGLLRNQRVGRLLQQVRRERTERIDFRGLAARLLECADTLVPRWLANGKRIGHEWAVGNLAGEPGRSLKVNLRTGHWADFATGETGGDLIALYAAIHRLRQSEAARELIRL